MTQWQRSVLQLVVRRWAYWLRLLPLVIGTAVATVILGAFAAIQLSTSQQIESQLGRADGMATAGEAVPVGQANPKVQLTHPDASLAFELVAIVELDLPRLTNVLFVETDPQAASSKGRYALVSGRWPQRPGEIVVTSSTGITVPSTVKPLVGRTELTVVGVAAQVYATERQAIIAAPGTWAAWPVGSEEARMAGLSANLQVLFVAAAPERTCTALLADASLAGEALSCETRGGLITLLTGASPMTFLLERGLPAVVIEVLAAVITAGLLSRLLRRTVRPLADVGVHRSGLRRLATILVLTGGVIAGAAGLLVGATGAVALRPLLASRTDHPLSPVAFPVSGGVGAILGLVLLVALARPLPSGRPSLPHALSDKAAGSMAGLGSLAVAAAIIGSLFAPLSLSAITGIVVAASVGVGLWAPQVLMLSNRIPLAPGRGLAATRAIAANSRSYAGYVALTAGLIGLVCSSLAIVGGVVANINEDSTGGIPPGMVVLDLREDGNLRPLPDQIVASFERELGLSPGVRIWAGADDEPANGDAVPWWAFTSVEHAKRIFPTMTDDQSGLLERTGRVVVSTEPRSSSEVLIPRELHSLHEVRVAKKAPPGTYKTSNVYVGLSPEQDRQAAAWANDNGINPGYVEATKTAPGLPIPMLTAASAAAFAVLTGAMSAIAMRSEVAALRGLLAGFHALGLGRRWCAAVLVIIGIAMSAVASVLGWIGALVSTLGVQHVLNGSLLLSGVPWLIFGIIGAGTMLGGIVGAVISSYRFSAVEVNGR